MEREYWLDIWERDQIRFHQQEVNPVLRELWPTLEVPIEKGVLVPLCGKSLDMRWLAQLGHPVWGVELSEKAITAYFEEAGEVAVYEPGISIGRYRGPGTTIYIGDYLELQTPDLKGVGAVFDRAALVALPAKQRAHYADHIQRIIPDQAIIVLLTIEYEQSQHPGPPFSVLEAEVEELYGDRCRIELLNRTPTGGLPPAFIEAGVSDPQQCVYRITKER
jgi:thiopurine S-methyltransferase